MVAYLPAMMIPDIQFSLLCEDVRREMNGNFQFLGVVADDLVVQRLPVRFFRLNVANRWTSGEGTFRQKTSIMRPDGHTPLVAGREIGVRLADGSKTHTTVETFLGVEFRETGTYWVEVNLDGELRMRYPFTIKLAPPPAEPREKKGA